jgi:hypothetical protein
MAWTSASRSEVRGNFIRTVQGFRREKLSQVSLRESLSKHLPNHLPVHIREPEVPPLETEGEPLVIEAQLMQDCRVEVVDGALEREWVLFESGVVREGRDLL